MLFSDTMARFMTEANLDVSYLPQTLTALKTDSQLGDTGGRGTERIRFGAGFWEGVDAALEEVGCPARTNMGDAETRRVLFGDAK